MKKILIIISGLLTMIAVGLLTGVYSVRKSAYTVEPLSAERIASADINNAKKLMIVAHPDDEVIWGGGHLMDGEYFVVCITNGKNRVRSEEFRKVMDASGNSGIILDYPDKVLGKRDNWEKVSDGIRSDLRLVMDSKDWETVVTHNENGEYGHQHHRYTNGFVTELSRELGLELWYFGKYYTKEEIDAARPQLTAISAQQLEFKEKLEKLYVSQAKTVDNLSHMNEFEMWDKAE